MPEVVRAVLALTQPRWAVDILTALGDGDQRYTDLLHTIHTTSEDPLHPRTFTDALRKLTATGLIARTAIDTQHVYHLTGEGRELVQLLNEVYAWGTRHAVTIGLPGQTHD
jgi:DNA-binding HxlR family transcriptional regulator